MQLELTPRLTSMLVVAETDDAVYVRLPDELQRDCGGCSCPHCKRNPALAKWDTLVVPKNQKKIGEHTYTVHMPDATQFREHIKTKAAQKRAEKRANNPTCYRCQRAIRDQEYLQDADGPRHMCCPV